jgi:type I restriction enzyme S subunit
LTANYQNIRNLAGGEARDGLNLDLLGAIPCPIPPLAEQQTIARFLDAKSVQIDGLVAKKRQLIDKLKEKRQALIARTVTRGLPPEAARTAGLEPNPEMRESGVEWLGRIPKHWATKALRYIFRNRNARRVPLSSEERADLEKLYPYYGASGVIDMVDDYLFDEPLILVAEDGANLLSRSTPLAFLATGKCWVNNHAHILQPLRGDIRYWVASLETLDFSPLITGAAQPKLTADRLGSIRLPVPPEAEQVAIADYLANKTAELDGLVAQANEVIDRVTEYRGALITAAVSGQIDVREPA